MRARGEDHSLDIVLQQGASWTARALNLYSFNSEITSEKALDEHQDD